MTTACGLQLRRIRATSGEILGRLYDLRCQHRGDGAIVTELVFGRRGLLERLGFRDQRLDTLPWSCVSEIRDDEIIVTANTPTR
jgi:sporulation protein YlmC with PRC-barrel domain